MSKKEDLDKLAMDCFKKSFSDLSADDELDILDLYLEREE
jgi:hypothetical protein